MRPDRYARQGGVALAVVLWFIAGMSVLVAGTVMTARTDVRLAQVHLARAQVAAAGDGAINLLLADMLDGSFRQGAGGRAGGGAGRGAGESPLAATPQQRYRVGDDEVSVLAVSETLLVDVNSVTAASLASLIAATGATPGEGLARAVVQYRDAPGRRRSAGFESIEDLLGVRGMNRATLDALRDYISTGGGGPQPAGNGAMQSTIEQLRYLAPDARATQADLRPPPGGERGAMAAPTSRYRVDALVRRGNDVWLRRRWVNVGGGRDILPWRFTRTEPVRMVPRGT